MLPAIRLVIGIAAAVALLIGLILLLAGTLQTASAGLWLIVLGVVGLIGVGFERFRYHSEAAERGGAATDAAGADAGRPEPRFQPTEERFTDPTTRRQLRVWVDPASGERRYRPDE